MLYSVRMRAAKGGDHKLGGRHISGTERLVMPADLAAVFADMLERALNHSRGRADFIQVTVEEIDRAAVQTIRLLPITTIDVADVAAGRREAVEILVSFGVNRQAAIKGIESLSSLQDSMRGAMIISADTGERLDEAGDRGVRVSRMDAADHEALTEELEHLALCGAHVREALVLATKVAAAPGMVAELCWSDDPEYTTGYIASKQGYRRLPHLKEYGNFVGGRIFFVDQACDLTVLADYLERQPVLVATGG
ncbi:MAG TPA: 6-carboxyhexanoate--CoA ligase [Negativicutes bacterium]|nr:6-carboxyhexanoate--CoA ligase [Negativicutes bacterium]